MSASAKSAALRPLVALVLGIVVVLVYRSNTPDTPAEKRQASPRVESDTDPTLQYQPRKPMDSSGFTWIAPSGAKWKPGATFQELAEVWDNRGDKLEWEVHSATADDPNQAPFRYMTSVLVNLYEGRAAKAYDAATSGRAHVAARREQAEEWLYTFIYFQGIASLRRGEDENCIQCRGESSCILPISSAAIHTIPGGSRQAIVHLREYLDKFPDDAGVRWSLDLAYATLGEPINASNERYRVPVDHFHGKEHSIGKFTDIGHRVGINRLNQAGGAILEDFDGDGLMDFVVTAMDPRRPMAFYRNKGDGTFEDRTQDAGVQGQLGGLYCVQTDFNNDGHPDIFICRGAWFQIPMRPSLLKNNGNGTFSDVTEAAGVAAPVNSISAAWGDYDNDGGLDLFVCCETGPNKLYRNKGNGTFEEVAEKAGVAGQAGAVCKGANWIDFDNDGAPDLYLNHLNGTGTLFRNSGKSSFVDVTREMGLEGPEQGFSCWAWDFDNDGWLDIYASSYVRPPSEIIRGMQGLPAMVPTGRLFRNVGGKKFDDVTTAVSLDKPFAAMGSNFADLDNDGWLDFYLGTGDPNIDMLVPNRMLRNLGGFKFADISSCSGTAHLQKGHAVAIGDWDRNGTNDIFVEMGGAIPGDQYHNILFQNPGNDNNWLNVRLVGKKTNRPAIGARIKLVTGGPNPREIHRHISTGSSFGANPFEQLIGLGKAESIARLEITWPTSKTTQVFRDLKPNQAVLIEEFATQIRTRNYKPIAVPPK